MNAADAPTRRALRLLGVVALIGILQVGFLTFVELDRTIRHRSAIAALEEELEGARAEAEGLRAIADRADDASFREQLARRQGFVYADEVRVVVLDGDQAP